ncbi:DUF2235 domain-containing protein [Sulfitobacter guttiformis]|nr:DUF2235 domain-containing protein [Sulfitobacter guttiformis]KIN73242.1 DUF2235 domain containing protein [Sulfitobacter guttiformis KCTC 32187]
MRNERPERRAQTHLIILDGTMSSLGEGAETNAGLLYRLAQEVGPRISIYYEPGLQWSDWRSLRDVCTGRGINRQIKRAYGYLSSRYRVGDRIYLIGYSRGAYAVRSLAGVIDRLGLLRSDCATERNIRQIYRHYEGNPDGQAARFFARTHCHTEVPIEMIGVWDTVKSLGINAPILWRLSVSRHAFHNHALGRGVKRGFHALGRDETRVAYRPVLWDSDPALQQKIEQVWFRGSHGDVGGQLGGRHAARPLANIPLVWMLEQAQAAGLPLPASWEERFAQDVSAPSIGTWVGIGRFLMTRRRRVVGRDPSERLHHSIGGNEIASSDIVVKVASGG